jgi:hypothetical protein
VLGLRTDRSVHVFLELKARAEFKFGSRFFKKNQKIAVTVVTAITIFSRSLFKKNQKIVVTVVTAIT